MERPVAQMKIEDALRRVERHRTMLAELVAVQSQTLRELRELVAKTGAALPEDTALAESEEELRQASLLLARSAPQGQDGPAEARKILIIDDDPTTRNLIAHFLQKEDFIVIKAADGGDGLARARIDRPDLLVVDAAAPGLNGFELLARLKQDPETSRLPVLILSSLDDEEAIVQSLDAGADYIIKPFSPRILVAKIKMILKEAGDHAVDRRSL